MSLRSPDSVHLTPRKDAKLPRRRSPWVTFRRLLVGLVVFSTHASVIAQEAIFSHREYAKAGRTYQQLWVWTPDGRLKALTNTPRDHQFPSCEDHGQSVLFNSEENGFVSTRWRLDRATEREELVGPGSDYPPPPDNPSGSPATCDARSAVRSPDGTRFVCTVKDAMGTVVFVADSKTGASIARVPIDLRYTTGEAYPDPPEKYIWAPDSRSLLAGFYGEDGGSTNLEAEDYFVLDLSTMRWAPRAFFGTGALWLTPRVILYVTARDLSPLTTDGKRRSVWTAHLTTYDPVTHSSRAITSGLSNDLDPVSCER